MKLNKSKLIIGLVLIVVLAFAVIYLRNGFVSESQAFSPKYKEFEVKRGTFQIVVSANGVVIPIDRVEVKSKASGVLVYLPVEEGDFVRKGEVIARLDQKDERAAVAQAQADLEIAQAEVKQAERSFARRDELFKRNLISEEERDQIVLSLAVAKGKLVQASTTLERAQERLGEAVVRAPINGLILQKYVEEGQIVASGVSAFSGGNPIVDIADMSSVYVETGIDEIDIGKVKVGQTARVTAEAYPNMSFKGTIVRIAPEAKIEQNVTLFDVIVEVENKDGKLKSGMNTNLEITIVEKPDVLLVPAITLQGIKGDGSKNSGSGNAVRKQVLLKKGDGFTPHPVKTGMSNFKEVEIIEGLKEGDILGVPMVSRLKAENDRMEQRIKSSRSFGTSNSSSSQSGSKK